VETEGKLALMKVPPAVLTDHHEFRYYRSFFPPNDDPLPRDRRTRPPDRDLFGPAFARSSGNDWAFFSEGCGYDLFAHGSRTRSP
jgi:hypothetical protein